MSAARTMFLAQRYSAVLLGPLVIIHLVVILYAVRNGLSADEILGRTRGSMLWFCFYTIFVIAVTVHAPIGLRNILNEWTALSPKMVNIFCIVLALLVFATGMRAVMAVT